VRRKVLPVKKILVATDFSERSDRAIRRATLLAREFAAPVTMVHSIDDDQPQPLIDNEREIAEKLLGEQVRSLREIDGVKCDFEVILGDPFEGITAAAGAASPDILVIGPHRRQALKDVFTGTTAERTIRVSGTPVLMANGVPAGPYRHILVAVDFSDSSAKSVETVTRLGLDGSAGVTLLHVFDAPGTGLIAHSAMTREGAGVYIAGERTAADEAFTAFLKRMGFEHAQRVLRFNESSIGEVVAATAEELSADLIVISTHGRSAATRLMLGSVADEVMRKADCDVLIVPAVSAD
jgi:nucleotide-binding universal stress UspA family protein